MLKVSPFTVYTPSASTICGCVSNGFPAASLMISVFPDTAFAPSFREILTSPLYVLSMTEISSNHVPPLFDPRSKSAFPTDVISVFSLFPSTNMTILPVPASLVSPNTLVRSTQFVS